MRTLLVVPFALAAIMAAPAVRAADPSVTECLAATENALKLRSNHKLRRAREQLLICGATTCPAMVRADCTRGVDEDQRSPPDRGLHGEDGSRAGAVSGEGHDGRRGSDGSP